MEYDLLRLESASCTSSSLSFHDVNNNDNKSCLTPDFELYVSLLELSEFVAPAPDPLCVVLAHVSKS